MAYSRQQVLGMFNASPETIMQQERQRQAEMVQQIKDPYQQMGTAIGVGLGRLFGGESAEVTRARKLQETLQGVDMSNPEQMTQAASILNQAGFPNEAMQLLARADEFKTSAQRRSTSQAQEEAARAELKRGQFKTTEETIAHPVTKDGQTFYVPVKARVRYDLDTGDRLVQTSNEQLTNQAQAGAAKMKREELAAQSEQTLRDAQLQTAQNQKKLIDKQLTAAEKEAGLVSTYVKLPVRREETDPFTQRVKIVEGFEYKAIKAETDADGQIVLPSNLQNLGAVVVDEEGLPQNAVKIEEGKQTTIRSTVSGQEFVVVGAGDEAKYYQVITEGDTKYYIATPESAIDPKTIKLQQPAEEEEEQPTQSNLGRKGQMSRGTTMTKQPTISSRPRTSRKR